MLVNSIKMKLRDDLKYIKPYDYIQLQNLIQQSYFDQVSARKQTKNDVINLSVFKIIILFQRSSFQYKNP
ncbi:unnamed protein product [Paramecium sonneborni]|uniref:Uncharacterized protein n=1 Tax=Paramecium sonneborni TaxID=65129 RepID=A0A8S1RR59_9CILI|nr:unnamed protein product [Paramecium sonneborni]